MALIPIVKKSNRIYLANLTEKIDCKEEEETRVFSAEDFLINFDTLIHLNTIT